MDGPRITIIVGLPGSGKSALARELAEERAIAVRPGDHDFLRSDLRPPDDLEGSSPDSVPGKAAS
jgi:predicted kinase